MSLFNSSSARPERTAADVQAGQSRAKLDDANASTRNATVTVSELANRNK